MTARPRTMTARRRSRRPMAFGAGQSDSRTAPAWPSTPFWVTKPPLTFAEVAKGGGWGPNGHGVLTEAITLVGDGQSYASTLTYEFFDAAGKPGPGGGAATGRAVRMGF
jgi:hypothetical protein